MREFYAIKSQIHYLNNPKYTEVLSGKHSELQYKAMIYEVQSLIRR